MAASAQLFELVRALTPSEKRHFRLYASKHVIGGKNNYMKLFDVICRMDHYDEEQVKRRLKGEALVKNLAYEKNYLYGMVMDSLHEYHVNATAESRMKKQLHQVAVLFEKGLFAHCDKLVRKVLQTALQLERFIYVYESLLWQKRLLQQRSYSGVKERELKKLFEQTLQAIDRLKNHAEYANLSEMLRYLIDTSGQVRSAKQKRRFDEVIRHPLMKNEDRALSDSGKRIYNSIRMNYNFYTNGRLNTTILHTRRELELLEARPQQVQENPNSYIGVLGNFIITLLEQKNYAEARVYLEKLRRIPENFNVRLKTNLQVRLFVLQYSQELTLYIETGMFEKIAAVIGEVEEGLERFEGKIGKTYAVTIYYNIAYMYLGAGEFRKALKWLNLILQYADVDAREDIISFSKLLQLIVYFELNDTDLLPYAFRSTYRFLVKRKKVYKGETMLLDFIRQAPRLDTREKMKQGYIELKKDLEGLKDRPFENNLFVYFDFLSWLESKITGRSFGEICREKAQ